ncbi:hypothetical protein [Corynebacterium epidermidicanis]
MGSNLPEPDSARFRTVRAHFFYGLGIVLTGKAMHMNPFARRAQ